MEAFEWLAAIGIGIVIFASMLLAIKGGYYLGRRLHPVKDDEGSQLGAIQGSILGLLGLLLGFSFAAASGRFIDRQDMIVRESNAIGTAYLRADLLEDPHRSAYRDLLRQYTASRIRLFKSIDASSQTETRLESERLHTRLWQTAIVGVKSLGHSEQTILPPLNDVIDLHQSRLAIMHRHLPPPVVILLVTLAAAAVGIVGYGNGMQGKRNRLLTTVLAFLISAVLFVTIDFDYPRSGILLIRQQPMEDLYQSMQP